MNELVDDGLIVNVAHDAPSRGEAAPPGALAGGQDAGAPTSLRAAAGAEDGRRESTAEVAVGGVEETPVVEDGELRTRPMMRVTMSCDHRTIDGATGSRFLQTLRGW